MCYKQYYSSEMLKQISRLLREQFERKLLKKKDTVDYSTKHDRSRYYRCRRAKVPAYVLSLNRNFKYERLAENVNAEQKEGNDKTNTCKTSRYLNCNSWFETLGLSSTFAFAFTLNNHFHIQKRQLLSGYDECHYYKKNPCIFKKVLNSQNIWKKLAAPKHVLAQPPALQASSSPIHELCQQEQDTLPVYGPETYEEALKQATKGVRNARNVAIGELENRRGLNFMSRKRYKKAVVHFSAGMALENGSAAYNLAQCYELGLGTVQDFAMAAKCYRRASDLGNATAMYNLAVFYVHGWGGLKSDRHKAEELMQKAALLGEPNAKALCENRLKKTTPPVVPEINDKARKQECRKEVQTVVDSLMKSTLDVYQLPHATFDEIVSDSSAGTCSSKSRNSVLFSEIDVSGSSANYYSGICYENGIGMKQNFGNAIKHYSNAAFTGNSQALYNLAACYETTARSNKLDSYQIPLIMDLYKMAADHGHQYATERLKTLQVYEILGTLKDFLRHPETNNGPAVTIH